jgi:rod shape-determining protein MreC
VHRISAVAPTGEHDMRRLYEILLLFQNYALLAFLTVISVILLALNDNAQIHAIRGITISLVGSLQEAIGFVPNYFNLRRENSILREQNVELSDEVSRLREAKLENGQLRRLLGLREQARYNYVSANVVGKNLQLLRNTITIDVGEKDGVKVDMPIVSEGGLVGKVIGTSRRYAIGQILLNKDFRASVKVQRPRVDAILAWEGGERLILKNVVKTFDVHAGDLVITSEYSSLFPPGIRVGVVSKTVSSPASLFLGVEVTPTVDFPRLEQVFVITRMADTSRTALEQAFTK